MTNEQSFFLALGALVAVAVVLLVVVIFGATVTLKVIGYAARFRGIQLGRNARDEMTFGGIIDETPAPARPSLLARLLPGGSKAKRRAPKVVVDKEGHPVPAKDLAH